jgi:hypothetical protein
MLIQYPVHTDSPAIFLASLGTTVDLDDDVAELYTGMQQCTAVTPDSPAQRASTPARCTPLLCWCSYHLAIMSI